MTVKRKVAKLNLATTATTAANILQNTNTDKTYFITRLFVSPAASDLTNYDPAANKVDIGIKLSEASAPLEYVARQIEISNERTNSINLAGLQLPVSDGTNHPAMQIARTTNGGVALDCIVCYYEHDES